MLARICSVSWLLFFGVFFNAITNVVDSQAQAPDKAVVAVSTNDGKANIWLCDPNGQNERPLAMVGGVQPLGLVWSPDGEKL